MGLVLARNSHGVGSMELDELGDHNIDPERQREFAYATRSKAMLFTIAHKRYATVRKRRQVFTLQDFDAALRREAARKTL